MKIFFSFMLSLTINAQPVVSNLVAKTAAENFLKTKIPVLSDELSFHRQLSYRHGEESLDSFHTIDVCSLADRMNLWRKHLPQVEVFYALKMNHDKVISAVMASFGAGFDCASIGEMEQIINLVPPDKIIFSHPMKPDKEIKFAKKNSIKKIVIDCEEELQKVLLFYPRAEVIIRIITDDEHSETRLSSKFGANLAQAQDLLDFAHAKKVNIVGISFHVGSNSSDKTAFTKALQDSLSLFQYSKLKHVQELTILDLGGGWPGNNDERFIDFAKAINVELAKFPKNTRIIAEPGRFFATKTTTASMKIIGTKEKDDGSRSYYLSNGAYGAFYASIYFQFNHEKLANEDWNFQPLTATKPGAKKFSTTFFGPTCDSEDKIVEGYMFPRMFRGDFIYTKNIGSYAFAVQSAFNQITPSTPFYICKTGPISHL